MSKSALQRKLEQRQQHEEGFRASLAKGKEKSIVRKAETMLSFDKIVNLVRRFGIVNPVRDMSTFNRSLKTTDVGKQAIAIASHLYGKYKIPQHLTNAWNFMAPISSQDENAVTHWRRAAGIATTAISPGEIEIYCAWYSVAASGGSLWKEHTRSYKTTIMNEDGTLKQVEIPMFTKMENHVFLTCPLKDANVRQAVVFAIASTYNPTYSRVTRLCQSKLVTPGFLNGKNPVEIYTRRIWREVIHFFVENEVTIDTMNDLLDFISHSVRQNADYSLKGRTLITLKRNMQDWHWELNRVKRLGNASWADKAVPVPNESFEIPQTPGVIWTMEQITTSKGLASEGTAMHHCVYSYQPRCIAGKCAIWSLKKEIKKKGFQDGQTRALTIEMDTVNGALVQIRGIANRSAYQDEMAAVRNWAGRHNFSTSRR